MDKWTPHYDLGAILAGVEALGVASFSKAALDGGRSMGLTSLEMLAVVGSLTHSMFYKSMTTYTDHRIWQDVYHAPTPVGRTAYIKVTVRDTAPVIQFKEK